MTSNFSIAQCGQAASDALVHIICWVSREALDLIDGRELSLQNRMVCFERYRFEIEQAASKKYGGGEHSPIVMSFDVHTLS
jgi:hypothetical protein